MKILLVCENYYPHQGGAEVLFKNLAERFVQRGHTVTVLTHRLKGAASREKINGVAIERAPSFFSRYVFTFASIWKAIRLAQKHDLIQTTTFNAAFPAWLAATITKKPVVLTVHEVWIGKWKEITGFPGWKCWIHDVLERLLYRLPFNHYVCVSEATKNDLLKLGIPAEKATTIHNGFDYSFWNPKRVSAAEAQVWREDQGLTNRLILFSWGRPGPSKGFEYAIRAMPAIIQQLPAVVLVLMFGTAEKYKKKHQELLQFVSSINLPNHIKIIDSLPPEQLRTMITAADLMIIPSVSEGFGYAALEAIAMNKPVIVSNAGSLPEIVSGKYQIFQNRDVPDLVEKVLKAAKKEYLWKKRKKFSWEEGLGKYVEVYRRV